MECVGLYFYPRSPCGERRWSVDVPGWILGISIHALLAESDVSIHFVHLRKYISIHALLAESDRYRKRVSAHSEQFLSTLSLRRATVKGPCVQVLFDISIHALLAESDSRKFQSAGGNCNFYPRSPCGERPRLYRSPGPNRNFYPRSPCGERRSAGTMATSTETFLSTLSLRRATTDTTSAKMPRSISIHALLAESDQPRSRKTGRPLLFLSTLSLRRATMKLTL